MENTQGNCPLNLEWKWKWIKFGGKIRTFLLRVAETWKLVCSLPIRLSKRSHPYKEHLMQKQLSPSPSPSTFSPNHSHDRPTLLLIVFLQKKLHLVIHTKLVQIYHQKIAISIVWHKYESNIIMRIKLFITTGNKSYLIIFLRSMVWTVQIQAI